MTRQELDERLVDYLYDELSDEEANRFEAAVAGHPDLEAEVEAHRRTREAAGALTQRQMSPAVMAAVMAEARAAVAPAAPGKSWFESLFAALMQPAMMTAALLFVVGGTSVFVVSQQTAPHEADGMAHSPSVAKVAEEAPEVALVAKPPLQPPVDSPAVAAPAASEAGLEVAAVDAEPPAVRGGLGQAGTGLGGGGKGDGVSAVKAAADFKPVSPTVSRLVEVDGDAFKEAKPARARLAAKGKRRAKRAKARPLQVAKAKKSYSDDASGGPFGKQSAARPMSRKLGKGAALMPQAASARAAKAAPSPKTAMYGFADQAVAEEAPPAAAAAPPPRLASAPPAPQAEDRSARKRQERAEPVEVRGKRLVTEFDRLLKLGNTKAAAKTLERLAAVPGFAKTAKRKRAELRKVEKARAKATKSAPVKDKAGKAKQK